MLLSQLSQHFFSETTCQSQKYYCILACCKNSLLNMKFKKKSTNLYGKDTISCVNSAKYQVTLSRNQCTGFCICDNFWISILHALFCAPSNHSSVCPKDPFTTSGQYEVQRDHSHVASSVSAIFYGKSQGKNEGVYHKSLKG